MTTATAAAVAARSLTFSHPSGGRGVVGIDLDVLPGERLLVLGPNGSGKSTLIHLLVGLLRPSGGSITVLGIDPATRHVPRRRIGVALDRVAHWEPLRALENLVLLARAAGVRADRAASRGTELLQRFGVDPEVPVHECSLGMRRKLLLAEALVHEPTLLLLDEPTLGLDPAGVDALAAELAERSSAGAAAVISSNDVSAAAKLGQRVAFLVDGHKVADAPIDGLLAALRAHTRLEVALGGDGVTAAEILARSVTVESSGVSTDAPGGRGTAPGLSIRHQRDGERDLIVADSTRGAEPLPDLLRWLLEQGAIVRDVRVREPDLDDVYRQLTGRTLQDPN